MKVANFFYILSWALAATTTSASPLTNDLSLSRRGNAMSGAKASFQNAGLAVAAKGHECNTAARHLISGSSACCPAYQSCISTRRDAMACGKEYNTCKATHKGAGAAVRALRRAKLTGGDCADPTKAATPEGRACCPARASCLKKSKTAVAMRECESGFVQCLGRNGA